MSTEENKALVRHYVEEVWNKGNVAAVDELFAPNYVDHHDAPANTRMPAQWQFSEVFKPFISQWRTTFPDFRYTIELQVAEGDLVVTRWSVQGTHQGKFRGHSPTGRQMTLTGVVIDRIVDGKAVEGWMEMDTLHQMQQLGVIPTPG